MNNHALVAALGPDAVAAVHGYRLAVLAEAERRGHPVLSQALSDVVPVPSGVCVVIDPIDIRLNLIGPAGSGLAGSTLVWNPADGWSLSYPDTPSAFLAGPAGTPLDLVPTPAALLDWADRAAGGGVGAASPPVGVELAADSAALARLMAFIDPDRRVPVFDMFAPGSAPPVPAAPSRGVAER